jgi:hypothetical protein
MAVIKGLRISLQPNEIVFPRSKVSVESKIAMDSESTQRALCVPGVHGSVRISAGGKRATWSPVADLPPGPHTFLCEEIASRTSRKLSPAGEIPFFVVKSKARIPSSVVIESMVRYKVGRLETARLPLHGQPRGRYVEVVKGTNRRSGAPVALAFNQTGNKINEGKLLASIARARAKKFGKLHPDLYSRLRKQPGKPVDVAVWLRVDHRLFDVDKPVRGTLVRAPAFVEKQRRAITTAADRCIGMIKKLRGTRITPDAAVPVVYARLDSRSIRKLARSNQVARIFLYDPKGIEDLDDSIAIANSDDVHSLGAKGKGVKVAVWESGPDSTANLVITDRFTSTPQTSDHSRHVHGIIRNKEKNKPKGHAPACFLHSANSTDLAALAWAVKDKGCTVINQSFHRSSEPKSDDLSFDDIYKDWLAVNWPYPTIVQAAGNYWSTDPDNINPPASEFVNHKGYNSLAVGNHNDSGTAMSGSSVFRNPATPHGDRELPEICANGTAVTTVGLTKSGTSMASPAMAGVAALLQSTNTSLKHWPEGCRAILLAGTTRNVVDNTWWQDVVAGNDASDGAGAVNALGSHRIAKSRRTRNAAATRRGWDVGSLRSADFASNRLSNFSYKVTVPKGILGFGPRTVKVALAWTSKVTELSIFGITIPFSSDLAVDLDLKVFDRNGSQVGYSGSWDNSYEIAEFIGEPGETYTIKIRRWSGTDKVWYGIAWTVTGGFLDWIKFLQASPRLESRMSARVLDHLRS